jgi:hypothetical protein
MRARQPAAHLQVGGAIRWSLSRGPDPPHHGRRSKWGADDGSVQCSALSGEWTDMNALANARPGMIATLDTIRDTLEDLGGDLGVTDPVSGPVVLALK